MISKDKIKQAKILIVDDDQHNIDMLLALLNSEEYTNLMATTDSTTVFNLYSENNFDLIILDLNMPGKNGFEVMEELNSTHGNDYVPILVVSSEQNYLLQALRLGAKDFINKPFNSIELNLRIHNLLEISLLYKEVKEFSQSMANLAMHDALTGLPNRRLLTDRLSSAIAHSDRSNTSTSIIYLDLNGFKLVNDNFGHDIGDLLLKSVSERLKKFLRREDTVARIGGDEFVIVLPELSHGEGLTNFVTKLLNNISLPYILNDINIQVSASAGISIYPVHSKDTEQLIKKADLALYESKKVRSNGYFIAPLGQ